MGTIAVLGESVRVRPFALGGAVVLEADDAASVRAAWHALQPDVAVLVLTPRAAGVLGEAPAQRSHLLVVTMP